MAEQQPAEKKFRASSAVTLKTLSAWEQANLSPWYHPQFWLDLLIHPSKEFTLNHQRRRARLYALVSFIFLIVSVIANCIFASDGRDGAFVTTHAIVNIMLFISYVLSRTHKAQVGKSLGVVAVWLLPYVSSILSLRADNTSDVTVTDSVNWLFTPSWMLMSTIFLSRSMTITMVLLDCFSLLLLPAFGNATFFVVKRLLFFHLVCGVLILMASIIAFRDKLQLYSQADGQSHEDQHQAGAISRFLLQPHHEITDRIFRRRSRILSAFLLGLIPCTIAWVAVEASRWKTHQSDGVVIGLAVVLVVASTFLYVLSRTQYTRWASRLTLFMLLITPYIYYQAPTTTQEGQLFANLLTMTGAAILGITLFSGAELVALAAIVFFPTVYSPLFPPHVILSLILLVSSFIYRRDIKEIHDTAVNRDDLYEDNTSDLLIPWDSKYLFGRLSYIQMVFAHYALGGFMLAVLGLAALIAATQSTQPTTPLVMSKIIESPATANYHVYVHTLDCSSSQGQVYTVTGADGMFEIKSQVALLPNTLNTIFIEADKQIGSIVTINMKTGTGGYALTQREFCTVDRIEVWVPATQSAYSTTQIEDASSSAQDKSSSAAARRLLRFSWWWDEDDFFFGNCNDNPPELVNGFFGQVVNTYSPFNSCKFFQDSTKKCQSLLGNKGFSPLCWLGAGCSSLSKADNRRMLCYSLGCSTGKSTCSGSGTCTLLRPPTGDGQYDSDTALLPVCDCPADRYGDLCQYTYSAVCPTTQLHAYNGTCTDVKDPYAGATTAGSSAPNASTFGEFLDRFAKTTYTDKISKPYALVPNATTLQPPRVTPAPWANSNNQQRNAVALGMIELLIRDVASVVYNGSTPISILGTGIGANSLKRGNCYKAPLEFANNQTLWIDLSIIYGQSDAWFTSVVGDSLQFAWGTTDNYVSGNQATVTAATLGTKMPLLVNAFPNGQVPLEVAAAAYLLSIVHDTYVAQTISLQAAREQTILFVQHWLREHLFPAFFDKQIPLTPPDSAALVSMPYEAKALSPILNDFRGEAPLAAVLDTLASMRAPIQLSQTVSPITNPADVPLNYVFVGALNTPANTFNVWADPDPVPAAFSQSRQLSAVLGLPNFNITRCQLLVPTATKANGCWNLKATPTGDPYTELYPGLHLEKPNINLGFTPTQSSPLPRTALGLTFGLLRKAYLEDKHNLAAAEAAPAGPLDLDFVTFEGDPLLFATFLSVPNNEFSNVAILRAAFDPTLSYYFQVNSQLP
jgi:hypothetical protein